MPFVDNIKLPIPVKKTNFMKDFTGEQAETEVSAEATEAAIKNEEETLKQEQY